MTHFENNYSLAYMIHHVFPVRIGVQSPVRSVPYCRMKETKANSPASEVHKSGGVPSQPFSSCFSRFGCHCYFLLFSFKDFCVF